MVDRKHSRQNESYSNLSRRWFIEQCGVGMGALALNHLLAGAGYAAIQEAGAPLAPKKPHFAPKAKNVIFLFMAGAPSHLEMFDYKPQLAKFDGTLPPPELLKGYRAAFINPNSQLLAEIQIREIRAVRRGIVGVDPAYGGHRRRHRDRQVDGDRRVQSRARAVDDE